MKNIRKIIPYVILSGIMALTAYTFLQIRQSVVFFLQDPHKYYNVIFIDPPVYIYAAVYLLVILLTFLVLEWKWQKGIFILFFTPLLIITYGKTQALLSVCLFFLSSLGLGFAIYSRYGKKEINLSNYFFATFLGICVNGFLIWGFMHIKVNYLPVYLVFFSAEIIFFRKSISDFVSLATGFLKRGKISAGQIIIILSFVFFIFYPLVSYYQWDELVNHLYISKYTSMHGIFHFSPQYPAVLDQSIIPKAAYTAVYILGGTSGEYAIRLLNYFLIYLTFFLFEYNIRKRYGNLVSFYSVVTAITTPFLVADIGLIFIDSFALAASVILFIQLLNLSENLSRTNIILYFILIPLTYFSKQQSVFIIIPATIIFGYLIFRNLNRKNSSVYSKTIFLGSVVSILIFLVPFAHNYILTGNPVFPYSNTIFRSPFFYTDGFLSGMYTHMPSLNTFTDKLKLITWYFFTFNGYDPRYYFWMNRFSFGISFFIFFIFSPFIFMYEKNKKTFTELLFIYFIFLISVFLWLYVLTGPQMRYFITCLPFGSVLIAFTIKILIDQIRVKKVINFVVIPVLVLIFISNFVFQLSSPEYPYPLYGLMTDKYINDKIKYWQDVKKVFETAGYRYGSKSRGFLSYSPALYFADFNIEVDDWYNYGLSQQIGKANGVPELFGILFKNRKFDFLILTDDSIYSKAFNTAPYDKMLIREYKLRDYALYLPNPDYL